MAKTEDSLFDDIVETRIAPDGTRRRASSPTPSRRWRTRSLTWCEAGTSSATSIPTTPSRLGGSGGGNACAIWRLRRIA
jgi:hypothetical protein